MSLFSRSLFFSFLLFSISPLAWGQQDQTAKPQTVAPAPPLTLQQAIQIGLENNYGIRLARTDEQIVSNNVTRGNAGQLPSVNGNFTRNFTRNNVRQQLGDQDPRIANGAESNQLNANVALNWTVFDGLGMFIAYDRLKALEKQQQQITRATIEESIANITDAYYNVVRESGKIRSLEEALNIGQQRIDLTQGRVDVGVSAKVEVLTARVDYNADRSLLLQQQELLSAAKINLNNLLGRTTVIDFQPVDSIVVTTGLRAEEIVQGVLDKNPRLQQARLGVDVARYERRLIRADRWPQVSLTSGYGLTRNINGAAFFGTQLATNVSRNQGLNYGVVATIPIFNGFNQRRLEQNARVVEEQSRLLLDQTRLNLDAETEQALARYQNRLQLLELEEENILLARENVNIALARYRLGLLTPLDLRVAQRSQLDAEVRLLDIRYQAKQAETTLRRLSGYLVQEGTPRP
ncbi:TolC family protein [Hymenobacter sp. HDW8]|uniref:TolC family protein n=1 Tax=Hymenobacter sp. HDW8 TaxID=2714932 RepID=UPI00140CA8A5|nr:TolC family protein [Hymenobacter sp. HDW8]QIL77341.1 TolC family protein [Hymenobacter sp. HDW8]